ncbi:hypothetical protein HDU92_009137 [Lobulomyces angularis]|nr:hypothetical protein HDU92_009137 [Lobulomyces angularis]
MHQLRLSAFSRSLSIGIRREGKNRWERRVPLIPIHVKRLVNEFGAKILIQPSTKRVFADKQYSEVGAIVKEDLSEADVIIGVKEVPPHELIPNKTYVYFSHTHKGQAHNMHMLKAVLDKKVKLIDYELITDDQNRRLVLFSRFAGYAGFMDMLHGLGQRLLSKGYGTPFLYNAMSFQYLSLPDARLDIARVGQLIKDNGLPRELGPLVFTFTGDGNVTQGAQHMFKCLPHEWVKPEKLKELIESDTWESDRVYGCQVLVEDYIKKKNSNEPVKRAHYYSNPEEYESIFHEKIAPYTSVLINGILWGPQFPRLLTNDQVNKLAREDNLRMISIADITCDINGSLEFMSHASTIDSPFFVYDPITRTESTTNMEADGIQIMSIDNLPTEMPIESSEYFSGAFCPFIVQLVKGNLDHPVLKRASITSSDGTLVDRFKHLYKEIEKHTPASSGITVTANSKNVLLLGSGFVAAPLVDYLLRDKSVHITIASNAKKEAEKLAQGKKNARVMPLDVGDQQNLSNLVKDHDVTVSFVPATMHTTVAEHCINHKKDMLTASYISPAMAALNERAKNAGITILNELGLDPGIDHLTAMKFFNSVEPGSRVNKFISWCGGLPAPENSDNPLGYKFSWSPRGVLLAGLNSGKFKKNNKLFDIPGSHLLKTSVDVPMFRGLALEGVPNRDSLHYTDIYGLGKLEDMDSMFRGTFRYKGYCELMAAFHDLGFFNVTEKSNIKSGTLSWPDLIKSVLNMKNLDNPAEVKAVIKESLTKEAIRTNIKDIPWTVTDALVERVHQAMSWLGMFKNSTPVVIGKGIPPTTLDAFCSLLQEKLVYEEGERDAVYMCHEFGVINKKGIQENYTSTLVAYGTPNGYSAMAKTVGLPAAMGVSMLLDGNIGGRGVIAPMTADIYEPLLVKLENEGIKFVEKKI